MLLYRVETPCGLGAYNSPGDFCAEARLTSPMPSDDVTLDWYGDWAHDWADILFSFSSLKQFREWFESHEIDELSKVCELSVYECDVHKLGDYQAVFDPERAYLVSRYNLRSIYDGCDV